jgi:hypothetical protein
VSQPGAALLGSESRLRSALILLACLAVVAGLAAMHPDSDGELTYYVRRVEMNERGALREYDVTATDVRLTSAIGGTDSTVWSEHVFVVVELQAVVRLDSQGFQNFVLRSRDGRSYQPRPEWTGHEPPATAPGFTSRGSQVFEVPRHRLAGAVLFVGPDVGEVTRYDAAVEVDLGLTGEELIESSPVALRQPATSVTA